MKKYVKLFLSMLTLSACTFGGGFVIIALMKKKYVDEYGLIDENEMLDITAIAQSCPGPIALNAAVLTGYRIAGITGILVSSLGCVLPPLVIITLISFFYNAFRQNVVVSMIMTGILAGVCAIVLDVVLNLLANVLKEKCLIYVIMLTAAFLANVCFHVSALAVVLSSIIAGLFLSLYDRRRDR